jgi:hypothetical protein
MRGTFSPWTVFEDCVTGEWCFRSPVISLCFVLIAVRVSGFMSSKHDSKHYTTCEQCTIVQKVF